MSYTAPCGKCGKCGKSITIQKDSTEGQKIYHGDCWVKLNKEVGKT